MVKAIIGSSLASMNLVLGNNLKAERLESM
jgi:hypothetical protein